MLLAASPAVCVLTAPAAADPVIAAAGDIACASSTPEPAACHQKETSDLLLDPSLTAVLALGDEQYQSGELGNFGIYYAPTWGRVDQITRPTPGNHEYQTPNAAGYFTYFNQPSAYYSYDLGSWHLISLNSEIAHDANSAQLAWLWADLAAHPADCVIAYWHKPRFSSGPHHSDQSFEPFWEALYAHGAEIVLSAHDHDYERFSPQGLNGAADPQGIRQFVVGTGGRSHYAFGQVEPNSEVRASDAFGVLKLTLHQAGYEWIFEPETGGVFADSGSASCTPGQNPSGNPPGPSPLGAPGVPNRARTPFRTPFRSSPGAARISPVPGETLDPTAAQAGAAPSVASSVRLVKRVRRLSRVLRTTARAFGRALELAVRSQGERTVALRPAANRLSRALRVLCQRIHARALSGPGSYRAKAPLVRSMNRYARAVAHARQGLLALARESLPGESWPAARTQFRRALVLTRREADARK